MVKGLRNIAATALLALVGASVVPLAVGVGSPPVSAAHDPEPAVAFDNLEATADPHYRSFAFASQHIHEVGDHVVLEDGSGRMLDSVTVQLTSYACQSGTWDQPNCTTTGDASYKHSLTLTMYAVDTSGATPVLGDEIHAQTETFEIPFRPSADEDCTGPQSGWWQSADGTCWAGSAFWAEFDVAGGVELPDELVWTIATNTSGSGYTPLAAAGPYDALNVAAAQADGGATPILAGAIADPADLWVAGGPASGIQCDGAVAAALEREATTESCTWISDHQLMARITTEDQAPAGTVTVYPTTEDWHYLRENPPPAVAQAPVISTPPIDIGGELGPHAANIEIAANQGKTWLTPQFDGTRLDGITELSYWVFTDRTDVAPALSFDVRYRVNDTAYGGRLVFEPVYNGNIAADEWKHFDAISSGAGVWWSSNTGPAGSDGRCGQGSGCTWDEILTTFPDAQLDNPSGDHAGNLVVKLGTTDQATNAYVDGVTLGTAERTVTFDWEVGCSTVCYVSETGHDGNAGTSVDDPLRNIQTAVDVIEPGGTIHVLPGTYTEDVTVPTAKGDVRLLGAGADVVTWIGVIGGASPYTLDLKASGVAVDGFTFTRDADAANWAEAHNLGAINIAGGGVEISNNVFTHNRTAIYVGNGDVAHDGVVLHHNEIVDNRTGVFFFYEARDAQVYENRIADNWTIGVLFRLEEDDTYADARIYDNDLSGNWYSAVETVFGDSTCGNPGEEVCPPVPGLSLDMAGNYFGAGDAEQTVEMAGEPGYDAQIPVSLGGTATAPATPVPDLAGPYTTQIDFTPYLDVGLDQDASTIGFQPTHSALAVSDTSSQLGPVHRVQEGVDSVLAGGTVRLEAGTYDVSSAIVVDKPMDLIGPNAGVSPNDAAQPITANPARVAEATLHATAANRVVAVGADDVTIDGLRWTDAGVGNASDAQVPLIGAGTNFAWDSGTNDVADNLSIVNNLFAQPSRIVVYTNSEIELQDVAVDDNRVVGPTSLSGCDNVGACGRQLFNVWDADDVSFRGNSVIGTPGNTHRTRVLTVWNDIDGMTEGLTIADNTIRFACNFTCFTLSAGVDVAEVTGNDVEIDVGHALSFYQPGSGAVGSWTGGDVDVHHNRFAVSSDFAVTLGNSSNAEAYEPDLSDVRIYRNALTEGGIRNEATSAVFAECNFWGLGAAPAESQLAGLVSAEHYLTSPDLDGPCGTPTNVVAVAGDGAATIAWEPTALPAGAEPVEGYTVTATPDSATCSTAGALTCIVDGLANGTEYTFSVVAHYASADSAPSAASNAVTPTGLPGAPDVVATTGVESAIVTWTAPADTGGLPITGYVVTAEPGGATCPVVPPAPLSCQFDDLAAGDEYTFSVVASNVNGSGPAGTATATPDAPTVPPVPNEFPDFNPVGPLRLFDTRGGNPDVLENVPVAQVGEIPLEVSVTGHAGGVPGEGAGAVSLNVAATNTSAAGFVSVFPCGERPEASNLNFNAAGTTVANAVITPISDEGTVCFYSKVPTDLVVDLNGWFLDQERAFAPVDPVRVFDTRGQSADVLLDVPVARVAAETSIEVPIAGIGDGLIPAEGVKGVSLNVTATNTFEAGFVTVYPCGPLGKVSNVNYTGAGQTVPNAVITPISADGTLCFYAKSDVDLVVDINGWLSDGSTFESVDPVRVFDTRGHSPDALRDVPVGTIGGDHELRIKVTDLGDSVPIDGVGAVSLNVAVTEPIDAGFITVYPCGERGVISSVNYVAGQTVANAVLAPVSSTGEICFYSKAQTHLVVDLNGWTSSEPYAGD